MGLESESGETSCEDLDDKSLVQRKQLAEISEDVQNKVHRCSYSGCKASFRRPWRLAAHICTHTGERPYKCTETGCSKAYTNSTHLRRHIGLSHSLAYKKTYKCPHDNCSMELSSTTALSKHYKRIHETPFPYNCQYCNQGFKKHNQLKTHMFQHTGVVPYSCALCPMSFTTLHALKRHQRGHRTYICDIPECAETFDKWTLLRKHCKLEHPIKIACEYCRKVFKTKSVLKSHLQVHREPQEREVLPCPYESCPRFYYHIQNLTHHVRSSHEGKKHKCPHPGCERQLCTRVKLREHMKLHDPKRPLPTSKRKKARKIRCDAGKSKRSMAVKLSGVEIPYELEKAVVHQDASILEEPTEVESSKVLNIDVNCNTQKEETKNNSSINSRLPENSECAGPSTNKITSEQDMCQVINSDAQSCRVESVSKISSDNTEEINSSIESNTTIEQFAPLDLSTKVTSNSKSVIKKDVKAAAFQDENVLNTKGIDAKKIINCKPNLEQHSGIPMTLQKWIILMLKVMDEFYPEIRTDDQ